VSADERAAALARVRAFLQRAGVPDDEIDRAERGDLLDLLVADRVLVPAERRYNEEEVSWRSGMPVELARKFWRALGFSDVGPEDRIFTDLDVEAIVIINSMLTLGVADLDSALQLARVIGSSMSRIAEAEVSPALTGGGGPIGPLAPADSVASADLFVRLADQTLPAMARLLEFAWRRHVQAATRRAMLLRSRGTGALPTLCVGFADMVGFTMLSQQLSEDELAMVVSRFEEVAHYTVTGGGGRLVKMIGDEAMFVSESPVAAVRIALGLAEAYADDELLSDVRVGLAVGPVLVQDGDYYGPVVNLAHAVVTLAEPGTVLMSDDLHDAVLQEMHPAGGAASVPSAGPMPVAEVPSSEPSSSEVGPEFSFRAVRPRQIKDVGRVQLWALQRPGAERPALDRRIGRGWERLAEVLDEIEELRDKGERLLAGGLRAAVGELGEIGERGDLGETAENAGGRGSASGESDGGDAEGSQ
jgi:adenylate cyclase